MPVSRGDGQTCYSSTKLRHIRFLPKIRPFALRVATAGAVTVLVLALPSPGHTVPADVAAPSAATAGPVRSPAIKQSVDQLMATTSRLRGRGFLRPVDWEVVPHEQMKAQFTESQFDEDEIELAEKLLKKLGLIPPELDLRATLVALLGDQVVGYYDPEAKQLFALDMDSLPDAHVLGPAAGSLELNHTLVHELTHALQDQHFNLEMLIDEDALARGELLDDEVAARLALAEGDAMMVGLDFALAGSGMTGPASLALPPGAMEKLMAATLSGDGADDPQMANVPAYLRNSLFFPYTMGFQFAVQLRRAKGWAGVDAAYRRTPESTEQIIHVEKYLEPDRPTPLPAIDLTRVLGREWEAERAANMGELDVRLLMQDYLGADAAERISSGWDGDRLFIFSHATSGEVMIVWVSVWDTPAEAAEFATGYTAVLTKRYGPVAGTDSAIPVWHTSAGEVSLEQRNHWVVVVDALPASVRARVARRVWAAVGHVPPTP